MKNIHSKTWIHLGGFSFRILLFVSLALLMTDCRRKKKSEPAPYLGVWQPGEIKYNNQGNNLPEYSGFRITFNSNNTYSLSGLPADSFSPTQYNGNFTLTNTTMNLAGAGAGFANLLNFGIVNGRLRFTVNAEDSKIGSVILTFDLVKL